MASFGLKVKDIVRVTSAMNGLRATFKMPPTHDRKNSFVVLVELEGEAAIHVLDTASSAFKVYLPVSMEEGQKILQAAAQASYLPSAEAAKKAILDGCDCVAEAGSDSETSQVRHDNSVPLVTQCRASKRTLVLPAVFGAVCVT